MDGKTFLLFPALDSTHSTLEVAGDLLPRLETGARRCRRGCRSLFLLHGLGPQGRGQPPGEGTPKSPKVSHRERVVP